MTYLPPEETRWLPWAPIRDRIGATQLPDDLAYVALRASRKGVIPEPYARQILAAIGTTVGAIDHDISAHLRKLRAKP